jgi:hypothetical protein
MLNVYRDRLVTRNVNKKWCYSGVRLASVQPDQKSEQSLRTNLYLSKKYDMYDS